jgi:beta-alanine degradation protein BauB
VAKARPRPAVVDSAPVEEQGKYDVAEFADELARAPQNFEVGTAVRFENDHVRVWEIVLEPGQRGPFHIHNQTYFWTVVDPGRGKQRFTDGTFVVRDYQPGETKYLVHSPSDPMIHDLENVGSTTMRFITVELKH